MGGQVMAKKEHHYARIAAALEDEVKKIAEEMLAVDTDPAKRKQIADRLARYVETGGTLRKPH